MIDLSAKVVATYDICSLALRNPPLNTIVAKLVSAGVGGLQAAHVLRSVAIAKDRKPRLLSLLRQLGASSEPVLDEVAGIQRTLLLQTALFNVKRLETMPVVPSVASMFCNEFQFFARPSAREMHLFQWESYSFLAFAKIALLERFPAGQFHWEVSGLPRSWLFRVPRAMLPHVSYFIATQLQGFAPCFFPHMATRRTLPLLLEKECDRSWHRIARSIENQPDIKGLVASSWLHSTDTFKVSPHLSFMNKPFVESGAIVTTIGEAKEKGYLTGSALRRRLYENGEFRPTQGLILWSREQMIRWARSHPELSDGSIG